MTTDSLAGLEKRTWHYLQPPSSFEMAPCPCGNHDTQWSEFRGRLWCEKCQVDFVPAHAGIFDGPIGLGVCAILGISFDRFNMETQQVERFDAELGASKPDDGPRPAPAAAPTFADGHEHDWESEGGAWACTRCKCWSHTDPTGGLPYVNAG